MISVWMLHRAWVAAATSASFSVRRATRTRLTPSSASRSAMARPIPLDPPVTRAQSHLHSRLDLSDALSACIWRRVVSPPIDSVSPGSRGAGPRDAKRYLSARAFVCVPGHQPRGPLIQVDVGHHLPGAQRVAKRGPAHGVRGEAARPASRAWSGRFRRRFGVAWPCCPARPTPCQIRPLSAQPATRPVAPIEQKSLAYERCPCMFELMESGDRHAQIVRQLQVAGRVEVGELAARFATSEVTVRRDLDELATVGVLRRVRGGAVNLLMRGQELPFAMRELESSGAKAGIGEAVAGMLRDGEAVVLDTGTTTLAVARSLAGRRLTVMTLSLHAVGPLSTNSSITLMVPGGTARYGELSLTGPMTQADIAELRFDTAVLSCCGLSVSNGVTGHDLGDVAVKRAAMAASARTILVADSAKFARTALALICPADRIDVLVTDPEAPDEDVAALRQAGVQVLGV